MIGGMLLGLHAACTSPSALWATVTQEIPELIALRSHFSPWRLEICAAPSLLEK